MPAQHHDKSPARPSHIAKEDLEPGDILLRHYGYSPQFAKLTDTQGADDIFSELITAAQKLLLGQALDPSSLLNEAEKTLHEDPALPLLAFLISLFDGGGYTSAALVTYPEIYSYGEKNVLEVVQGQVQSTPLADYPEDGIWALRYCRTGIAMGDMQLPPGPVIAKAHHLHAIIEANGIPAASPDDDTGNKIDNKVDNKTESKSHTNTHLALLMLAIWRRCGSFRAADIQKYLQSVFLRPYKHVLDAFFAASGATLQKILQREALKAADILRSQQTQISSEFVAAAFNQASAGADYKISRGNTPHPELCPLFDEVSPALVQKELAALAVSINQHDAPLEVRKAEHVFSLLDGAAIKGASEANNSLFLPNDFTHSANIFPLGILVKEHPKCS